MPMTDHVSSWSPLNGLRSQRRHVLYEWEGNAAESLSPPSSNSQTQGQRGWHAGSAAHRLTLTVVALGLGTGFTRAR